MNKDPVFLYPIALKRKPLDFDEAPFFWEDSKMHWFPMDLRTQAQIFRFSGQGSRSFSFSCGSSSAGSDTDVTHVRCPGPGWWIYVNLHPTSCCCPESQALSLPCMTLGTFLTYLKSPSSEADHSRTRSNPYPRALWVDSHQKVIDLASSKNGNTPVFTPKNHVFSHVFSKKAKYLGVNRHMPPLPEPDAFQPWPSKVLTSPSVAQRIAIASFLARLTCDANRPLEHQWLKGVPTKISTGKSYTVPQNSQNLGFN